MASNFSPANPPTGNGNSTRSITLHVLCPSLEEGPNRFTFDDLPLSTTVAGLKSRLTNSIPGHPPPHTQRLIFRGRALLDNAMTLQTVLGPVNNPEYSMHLALPPPSTTSARSSIPSAYNPPQSQQDPFVARGWSSSTQNYGQNLRQRGTTPAVVPHEAELSLALQRNIEIVRRNVETLETLRQRRSGFQGGPTSAASTMSASRPSSSIASHPTAQQRTGPFNSGPLPAGQSPSLNTASHVPTDFRSWPVRRNQTRDPRVRLDILQLQVAQTEDELQLGVAPPAERIIRIRNQLCEMLDDQYRNLSGQRNGTIESLISRIFNVYSRADQLRITQTRLQTHHFTGNAIANPEQLRDPLYLLQSPDGYQALVASPGASSSIQTSLDSLHTAQEPETATVYTAGQPAGLRVNPEAVVMENVVRQAVLNQRAGNNGQVGLSRFIRRIWLFVRLYFFCYMFSDSGTWLRVVYVTLAVIISLLAETSIPRQLYNLTIAPVQRHLEGLVYLAPDITTGTGNQAAANGSDAPGGGRVALQDQLRQNLRRVERSVALFLASLVPGVGERHIEARNAAEAARNAQLAREEEERRRQQQEENDNAEGNVEQHPAHEEESAPNEHTDPAEQNALTANELDPLIPLEDDE